MKINKKILIGIIISIFTIGAVSAACVYYSNPAYVLECANALTKESYDSCMYLNYMINK